MTRSAVLATTIRVAALVVCLLVPAGSRDAVIASPPSGALDGSVAAGSPIGFEENRGQIGSQSAFFARAGRGWVLVGGSETTFLAAGEEPRAASRTRSSPGGAVGSSVVMAFEGGAVTTSLDPLNRRPGLVHYLAGSDPTRWITGIPIHDGVVRRGVYPGIDLVYRAEDRGVALEFFIAAGADPRAIEFDFKGAGRVDLLTGGDARIPLGSGVLQIARPEVTQPAGVGAVSFVPAGETLGLRFDGVDPGTAVRIRTSVTFTAADATDRMSAAEVPSVATDAARNVYLTSRTLVPRATALREAAMGREARSGRAPGRELRVGAAAASVPAEIADAFVRKIDGATGEVVYTTYLGGSGDDLPTALAVGAGAGPIVVGSTTSADLPGVASTGAPRGGRDAFAIRLATTGDAVAYGTVLGGSGDDGAAAVAFEADGTVWMAGITAGDDFPNGPDTVLPGSRGGRDAFVAKLDASGAVAWTGTLGGAGDDTASDLALDGAGGVYVTGSTRSRDFPVVEPMRSELLGAADAFVTKIDAATLNLVFSTYLGGSDEDSGLAVAVTPGGEAVIAGATQSNDFPVSNPIQPTLARAANAQLRDGFLARLDPEGTALLSATYFGGIGDDRLVDLAFDPQGRLWVAGGSESGELAGKAADRRGPGGRRDALVVRLERGSTDPSEIVLLGAEGDDAASGVAVDPAGGAVVVGVTDSTALPDTMPQGTSASGEIFMTRVASTEAAPRGTCPGTINFDNSAGTGAWATATNWDLDRLPLATDDVCIDGAFAVTMTGTQNAGTLRVQGGASLTINSGTLTIAGTSEINGAFEMNGGTLSGTGAVTVTGLFTWSAGTIAGGPGAFNAEGGIVFDFSTAVLNARTLNNTTASPGAVLQTGTSGSLSMTGGATFNNAAGALFEVQNDNGAFGSGTPASVFNNAGTFRRTTSSGVADIQTVSFNNTATGTVDVQTGTLRTAGTSTGTCGGTCSGAWKVATGATLQFNHSGTYSLSGAIGGAAAADGGGNVTFDSGTLNLTGSYEIAGLTTIAGSTVNFSAPGTTTIANLAITSGTLSGTSQIDVTGPLTWSSGTVTGGPAVVNANGGIVFGSSVGTLNGRTMNNTSASPGAVMQTGTNGYLSLTTGATFNNAVGALFEVQNDNGVFGSGTPTSTFGNSGTFRRTTSSGIADIQTVTFNNNATGVVEVQSGTLRISGTSSGTCGGTCAGAWKVATGATMTWNHSGTYSLSGAIGGATGAEGGGNVAFDSGTQNLTGTYQIAGETLIAGSTVNVSAAGTTTITTLRMTSGTLSGTGQVDVSGLFTWNSGTVTGSPSVFNANGGIVFGSSAATLNGRTMNHTSATPGAVVQTGTNGLLSMSNGATFNNAAGALFEIQNDNGVFSGGGTVSTFNNSGTIRRTTSSGVADIQSVNFNNGTGGAVEVQTGELRISGTSSGTCGGNCAGAWKVATGATLAYAHSGTYTLSGAIGGATGADGGGNVTFDSGTLNLTGTYEVAGETLVAGSTVNFSAAGTTTISTLRMTSGTVSGTSQIDVPGLFTWSAGTVTGGPAVLNANGGIVFNSSAGVLNGRTMNHTSASPGAVVQTGTNAYLSMSNGATFNNATGALFEVQNDQGVFSGGGATSTFNNSGTLRRTTASGVADIQSVNFNNGTGGSVEVQTGTLRVSGTSNGTCGGTCAGAWKAATGAILSFNHSGTYTLSGSFGGPTAPEGGGSVQFDAGTQNLTGTYEVTGETLVAGSTVNFSASGPTTIAVLRMTSGTLGGTSQIDVPGLFTWSSGTVTGGPAVFNANGGILFDSSTAALNGRTMNHTSASPGAVIQTGTNGYLYMSNGATFNNAAGALFELQNDQGVLFGGGNAPTFNNSGIVRRTTSSGVANIQSVNFNNGAGASVEIQAGTLQISGTSSGSCGGTCAGAWKVATGTTMAFAPNGTYALSGPFGGPTPAEGGGDVDFLAGTQNLTGTYEIAGETLVAGSTVNFSAASPTTIANLRMTSGTLGGTSQIDVTNLFTWSAGTVTGGPAPFNATGGILFDNSSAQLSGRTMNHTSASPGATMASGSFASLTLLNGAIFTNAAGALFDAQNDQGLYAGGGATPSFQNAGTFRRSTSSGQFYMGVDFLNTGSVELLTGTLYVATSYTQTAGSTILNGGTLTSGVNLNIQGGTLGGVGSFDAPLVNNTGGQLAPGLSAGKLTLVGDYTQGASGVYAVELGGLTAGTQHDQFALTNPGFGTGDATLNGALNVTLIDAFVPQIGDTFTILTCDTRTGQFATTNLPAFGCGKTWNVVYNPTSVVLEVVAEAGTADLTVTNTDAPDPIPVGDPLTYTVTVANGGPDDATTVTLTDVLPPAGVTYGSATPSQGSCSEAGGTVTCNLGTIANGGSATVTIVVTPTAPGAITNTASAGSSECDPNPGDETDITTGTTVLPACSDGDSDGFAVCDVSCLPGGGDQCGDCDDTRSDTYPGAPELCDGIDNDCVGGVPADEADADSDTYRICDNDCNDGDATINPGVVEADPLCADGIDNDCDTLIDLNDPSCLGVCPDSDNDGFADCTAGCLPDAGDQCGDCDDTNAGINPNATEITGDGVDQNCDGAELCYADADDDGYRPNATATVASADPDCADTGEALSTDPTGDCNDANAGINPGATEIAGDGVDQNCDGGELCFLDADDDGYRPDAASTVASADLDCTDAGEAVGTDPTGDCDDASAAINPGATEIAGDGVDQNCDGTELCFVDADDDGYRPDPTSTVASTDLDCVDPGEAVASDPTGDCDDGNDAINPGATEIAGDNVDQNCDGGELCFLDADDDGYRPDATSTVASTDTDCLDAGEAVAADPTGDCNDADAGVNPGAIEVCNGIDDDCVGGVPADEADADGDGVRICAGDCDDTIASCTTDCSDNNGNMIPDCAEVCPDVDGDGFAVCDGVCTPDTGDQCGDCDDTSAAVRPGVTEIAGDGVDQNCDGAELCFTDADDDGYRPNATSTVASADVDCLDAGEAVSTDPTGDCNDANTAINPGATEITGDGVDQNCDGAEVCYADADNDGYRPDATSTVASADTDCADSGEAVSADPTGDCNDTSAAINPGATEIAGDGVDQNCDGGELCYVDADDDGYRPNATATVASTDTDCLDSGEAASADPTGDCNDGSSAINPGATEIAGDGVDQNCDGAELCYTDADNDGYRPNATSTVTSADVDCLDSGEAVAADPTGDCNDANAAINPGATEIAGDGVDQNCDGAEVCYLDADNDGYRPDATSTVASADVDCLDATEALASEPVGDCNDADPAISPGATETGTAACTDEIDNDCDGLVDAEDLVGCGLSITSCSTLGDQPSGQTLDEDVWTFQGHQGESVTIRLEADFEGGTGRADLLVVGGQGTSGRFIHSDRSVLPNQIVATLPSDGLYRIGVIQQPSYLLLGGRPFRGGYCLTLEADQGAAPTLAPTTSVEGTSAAEARRAPDPPGINTRTRMTDPPVRRRSLPKER